MIPTLACTCARSCAERSGSVLRCAMAARVGQMNGNPAEITQRVIVGLGLQCAVLLPFVVIGALLMGVRG